MAYLSGFEPRIGLSSKFELYGCASVYSLPRIELCVGWISIRIVVLIARSPSFEIKQSGLKSTLPGGPVASRNVIWIAD